MRHRRWFGASAVTVLAIALGGPAYGRLRYETPAPKPLTVEQAADATLAAVKAKDDGALKARAAAVDPDPWLVADDLLYRSGADVAETFAKGAPRMGTEALPAYVASWRARPYDRAGRDRLARADAAFLARNPSAALDALGTAPPGPIEDVVGVRRAMKSGHRAHRPRALAGGPRRALGGGRGGRAARVVRVREPRVR